MPDLPDIRQRLVPPKSDQSSLLCTRFGNYPECSCANKRAVRHLGRLTREASLLTTFRPPRQSSSLMAAW